MFRLYHQVASLNKFSNGHLTDHLDFPDSMNLRQFDGGIAYDCPEQSDYWFGHCVNLFDAPKADITGEALCELWDAHVAPYAPKAIMKVVKWGAVELLKYPNIAEKYDLQAEVVLKFCTTKTQQLMVGYNVKLIEQSDYLAMVDIYVAEAGEKQRAHQAWRAKQRLKNVDVKNMQIFTIWQDGQIVSIAGLIWCDGIFRYASVTTRIGYRGKGYASAIVAHIRDYALSRNAKEIYIHADYGSDAAAMYQRAGFEIDRYFYSTLSSRD